MSILDKLPLAFSSLALANSVAIPFVFNRETNPPIVEPTEEPVTTVVATEAPKKKGMPKHVTNRFKEAMQYLECVEKANKSNPPLDESKNKESCRAQYWYWD